MGEWLHRLFDPSGFPPRWRCGEWSESLGWLHIASDFTIWFAYMGIPAVLVYLVRRRSDLPFLPVFWLFIAFVAACGFVHLVEASMFWWPAYRFSGVVKLATAVVSVATLIALMTFANQALRMPGTSELAARLRKETSARDRSEKDLVQSQEQLRVAAMASGVGLWDWRVGTDRFTWDVNTHRMLGVPCGESLGGLEFLCSFVHVDDRVAVAAALQDSVRDGSPFAAVFRVRRRDGSVTHLVARGSPVRDEGEHVVAILGAFVDVTGEEVSRELFRTAVEASPNAMMIVDSGGDIVLANAQAERVFGYPRAELIGKSVDCLVPTRVHARHPTLRDGYFVAPVGRKLGTGRELAGLRKDGTEVPLEIALSPVQLAEGPGVLAAIVDITERREMQAKLSQAERLAAVGELAAGVAHEINNPINTIINCAQLVLDGDDPAENATIVVEEGERITSIVKDLLRFARDDRGPLQPTSLAEVVGRCVRLIGENLTRHGISLRVDVPEDLPLVQSESQQLQQVLLNLLINAKDALQEREVGVARRIDLGARACGRSVVCVVRDNGPGIAKELMARVFEPFVTTKRARGGTGLGLSVSRSIVASFGGALEVESAPGEFAEFRVLLPLAAEHGHEQDAMLTSPGEA